ncbi:MAG: hypothetical protein HZC37_00810 [Burkholderiales bacterium]|nr:hypothetical protein [Burkholderiales bacterium]
MKTHLIALAALCVAVSASAVEGQKLDSGLGELPHYSQWADKTGRQPVAVRVAGESLDDGLGELPPYSQWLDKTGRDPMGRESLRLAGAKR